MTTHAGIGAGPGVTPVTDDQGQWLRILYLAIGLLWTALASAWLYITRGVATKRWVEQQLKQHTETDRQSDRELFHDLIAPLVSEIETMKGEQAERHHQNSAKLDLILERLSESSQSTHPRRR